MRWVLVGYQANRSTEKGNQARPQWWGPVREGFLEESTPELRPRGEAGVEQVNKAVVDISDKGSSTKKAGRGKVTVSGGDWTME